MDQTLAVFNQAARFRWRQSRALIKPVHNVLRIDSQILEKRAQHQETPANSSRVRLCLQGQLSNFLERHSDIRRLRTQKGGGRAVCGKLAGIDRVRGQSALLIRGPNKKWDFSVHASGAEFG